MYSEKVREMLVELEIETGDRISVNGREGILMPKPSTGDPEILILKQDSGYNVGLEPRDVELLEKNAAEDLEKPEIEHDPEKPDILVLHTGGTIASRVSYEEGGVKAEAFSPQDMAEMYPETAQEVNLHSNVYVGEIMSEDMEPAHWQGLAERIDELKDNYDGIVIGHGTDTLADTSAALGLMLRGINQGIMVVGAQRSSDRPSTDANMNVYCASKFLAETEFNGVGVCMHKTSSDDECSIIPGAKARKMHTSRRDAFKPINAEEIGTVDYITGEVHYTGQQINEHNYEPLFDLNENVGFLKFRPGTSPEKVQFMIEQDYDGVVIEGTGLGHTPISSFDDETRHHEEIRDKIEELANQALVVVSSNCIHGRTDLNVYDNQRKLQEAGAIGSKDMHPELAYVKLMWSLGNSESREEAEDLFREKHAGEIKKRSKYDSR